MRDDTDSKVEMETITRGWLESKIAMHTAIE